MNLVTIIYLNHGIATAARRIEQDVVPGQTQDALDADGLVDGDVVGDEVAHLDAAAVAVAPGHQQPLA